MNWPCVKTRVFMYMCVVFLVACTRLYDPTLSVCPFVRLSVGWKHFAFLLLLPTRTRLWFMYTALFFCVWLMRKKTDKWVSTYRSNLFARSDATFYNRDLNGAKWHWVTLVFFACWWVCGSFQYYTGSMKYGRWSGWVVGGVKGANGSYLWKDRGVCMVRLNV